MKSKVTLWNAFGHLIKDLIRSWREMDVKHWKMHDTLTVAITFILLYSLVHSVKLIYLIFTLSR